MASKRKTKVVLVIDTSSSMSHIAKDMENVINNILTPLRVNAHEIGMVTFNSTVNVGFMTPAKQTKGCSDIYCNGMTALFDAVGAGIEMLGNDPRYNYLVLIFTDGQENCSTRYNKQSIQSLIAAREAKGNWTITFQVPKGYSNTYGTLFGIPIGNICEWENTKEGTKQVETVTTGSINNYFSHTARGFTSSKNFYNVGVDMYGVTSKDVKAQLVDFKDQYKSIPVDRDDEIRPFIERKTRRPYSKGNCYYQLIKPEKVQKNKEILVMEKGKSSIFGGNFARNMIGLPPHGAGDSKVTPIYLGKFDIFIQSTSVNRKLPKGTKVLVKT